MFLKQLLQQRATAVQKQILSNSARKFSSGQVRPPTGGFGFGPMLGVTVGVAGFAYLGYKVNEMNRHKAAYMAQGQTYMSPLVQKRLSNTFGWFGYGILTTSAFVY